MVAARSTVAVAIALIISGCFEVPVNVVGQWQGRHPLPPGGTASEPVRNSLERVTLKLDAQGHYTMVWRGIPIEGSYSVQGKQVELSPRTVLRRPVRDLGEGMRSFAKAWELQASGENLVTRAEGMKIVLKRVP